MRGYDLEGLPYWWVHVQFRVEGSEVTWYSVRGNNDTLYRLAAQHGVDSYDGMDLARPAGLEEEVDQGGFLMG